MKARVPVGWRLAAAGGLAGMLTNTVLHPLDTVKTVRQADPARFPGVGPAIAAILRTRGPRGLYAGVGPALVGSALSSALYFGVYELARRRLAARVGAGGPRIRRVPVTALAAACGNLASSVLFVPKEVVKQRMQANVEARRFFGTAVGLVRAKGVGGLYAGYKATLLRNIPSTMIRFAIYEEAKLALLKRTPGRATLSTSEYLIAGVLAGSLASAATTPMDVIKTRFATGKVAVGVGIPGAIRQVLKEQGVSGLYVGIQPRMVWSAFFAAIGFTSYEFCKLKLVGIGQEKAVRGNRVPESFVNKTV